MCIFWAIMIVIVSIAVSIATITSSIFTRGTTVTSPFTITMAIAITLLLQFVLLLLPGRLQAAGMILRDCYPTPNTCGKPLTPLPPEPSRQRQGSPTFQNVQAPKPRHPKPYALKSQPWVRLSGLTKEKCPFARIQRMVSWVLIGQVKEWDKGIAGFRAGLRNESLGPRALGLRIAIRALGRVWLKP